nr:putative reverse transcriptase domain-containing protein [Tanacetum cinerariifolium]
ETTDKVLLIKEKLKAARDHQKSYADNRRKSLEFEVGDRVMLKVSPLKGLIRVGKKGKLAPRYVGPFEILERIGLVAYRLRLLEELSGVYDTFHVSNLKKCLVDASLHVPLDEIKIDKTLRFVEEPVEIMDHEVKRLKQLSGVYDTSHVSNLKKCLADASLHVPLDEIKIDKTLRFVEEPVEIMDHEVKRLKRSIMSLVKVRWNSKCGPKFTWEREDFMKSKYPQLFVDRANEKASLNLETRFPKGGDTVTTMT